jgi:hypothetical protein
MEMTTNAVATDASAHVGVNSSVLGANVTLPLVPVSFAMLNPAHNLEG